MTDDAVTLRREQVREIFKALQGIGNLVKSLLSKPGNAAEVDAVMSHIAVIQTIVTEMAPAKSERFMEEKERAARNRPQTGDVVIWDVEPQATNSLYWVREQGRGSATRLFEGSDAWALARSAAEELAGPDGTIWQRHKDGTFQKLSK